MARSSVEICAAPSARVATIVKDAAERAVASRGAFAIAIAGGSLVKMLGEMASIPGVEWDKWHVAWVDERCVPHEDKESNYGGARDAWLSKVPIPPSQVHAIDEKLCPGGGGLPVATAAAEEYERRLRALPAIPHSASGLPVFDLLLLGFGPDGHVCSLFPGHPLLEDSTGRWILPIGDSPKLPPERITLSMAAVNSAAKVVLVGTGEGKAEVVKSAFLPGCELPCAKAVGADLASPPAWVLDAAAAALLPEPEAGAAYEVLRPDAKAVLETPTAAKKRPASALQA